MQLGLTLKINFENVLNIFMFAGLLIEGSWQEAVLDMFISFSGLFEYCKFFIFLSI